jgi:hypothetical protein
MEQRRSDYGDYSPMYADGADPFEFARFRSLSSDTEIRDLSTSISKSVRAEAAARLVNGLMRRIG